jgi:hypothetical protein
MVAHGSRGGRVAGLSGGYREAVGQSGALRDLDSGSSLLAAGEAAEHAVAD